MADPMSQLRGYIHQTLSSDRAQRTQAEKFLSSVENQAGFPVLVMDLIATSSQSQAPDDVAIAQTASVFFKNTVKRCWQPEEDHLRISDADKAVVKSRMVEYMCNMPPAVQRQMSEALSIISKHDFPDRWNELLPELVSKFTLENFHVTNGVLATANSIMKRFRWVVKTDTVMLELTYCLEQLQAPLLALFQAISDQVFNISGDPTGSGNPDAYRLLMPMMAALRTITRIFFSLNWLDLPEFFEDHMGDWMGPFLKFLSYSNKTLEDPDEEDEPGPIEKLQTAIIENVSLYAEKYEEEFQSYLQGFAESVWGLLTRAGQQTKFDSLSSTGIRFLNTVVSKPQYSHLFAGALAQFLEQIIVPNLLLRESDEELFEDNPTEWIQKDMEGNDTDTRRRCAIDLVRGMSKHFETETTALCGSHIMTMLQQYSTDPANNWKAKDAALCLLVAVSVRASTVAAGVSQINAAVDINDMVAQHIIPELAGDVNKLPLIRADCLKFLATFRNQLPLETMRTVMPLVINHLAGESQVVQSYAANCVERMLTVKESNGTFRFGRAELQPMLQVLFQNLFVILSRTDESFENAYVMKAIMRCLSVAKEDVVPLTGDLLGKFNEALERVCKNPRNPQFNHYLFESTAVLVNSACSMDASLTDQFEALLFPPFQAVLSLDVAEFSPYVFQILAQLLEFRADGVSQPYRALFPPLLAPLNWERKANCPALVRLLKAYLKQGVNEVLPNIEGVLGIFQKLLALKSTENSAFSLLSAIVMKVPLESLAPYLPTIFQLLMMRLQQHKAQTFCYNIVVVISLIAAKHGGVVAVEQGLETVQAGITANIIQSVWIKTVEATPPTKASDAKVCCLGIARMLSESNAIKGDEACWGVLLGSLVSVLDPKTAVKVEESDEAAFSAIDAVALDGDSFSKLHFTGGNQDEDLFPEIPDAPGHACRTLASLCASSPGVYAARAGNFLSPEKATALQNHLGRAGVALS